MSTIDHAGKKTLDGVFQRSVFNIPRYQRAYAWEEENWRELWQDIVTNVWERDKEHFLGAIIYYHGKSSPNAKFTNFEVIDGQQRITTLTILMRVLFDKLKDSNAEVYSSLADELYEKYIGDTEHENFFLNLSKKDESFFRDYVQKQRTNRAKAGKLVSNKNIRKCFDFFEKKLATFLNENKSTEPGKLCWQLKKRLDSNLIFVVIDVNTDEDAYMIFESINSKRQGLTIADLLKNYIYSAADRYEKIKPESKKLSQTEALWERIEDTLDKTPVSQYVRHFWISKFGKVYEKELYQHIKQKFSDRQDEILHFVEELELEATSYSEITTGAVSSFAGDANLSLDQLRQLKNRQFFPLVLSALAKEGASDQVAKLVQKIASVAVRRAVVGKNPNELEDFFADQSSLLRRGEVSIEELITTLGTEYWISDELVKDDISEMNFEDQEYLAKFILREYENRFSRENEKNIGKVSLEHVLPRNPENPKNWPISTERQQELLWKLGNLALIGPKYNSKMSNKDFDKKKTLLKKTEIKTTSKLVDVEKWDELAINNRTNELADFIIKRWK